ncbi:MAG: ABC transporter permease [Anaerolineae bacterium]|jgi:ABC-2 type transport system permease protein
MLKRIWSLVIKEFIQLIQDWWMPAFMLFGGAAELLLVGWATSRPITNLPLMVLDEDQSAVSRAVVTALENTDTFALTAYARDLRAVEEALDRGDVSAGVVIPADFADQLDRCGAHGTDAACEQPSLSIWLDGAESMSATAAYRAAEGAIRRMGQRITLRRAGLDERDLKGFDASLRVWFNEALSEALYTTPAELGLMLEFTVLLFAALSFARERELGTLEQLLVMPFSSLEIIIGKALPAVLIGFSDFLLMLGAVHFVFNVPVRGSLPLLLVLAAGYVLVELSKGLVISVISRSQHQAFLLVMMVGMTDFMFTGYAAPVESMPPVLQAVANVIPAHHWLTILRGLLLKGAGLDVLWPNVLALAGLGLVIGAFSLRYVRRVLD